MNIEENTPTKLRVLIDIPQIYGIFDAKIDPEKGEPKPLEIISFRVLMV